MPKPTLDVLAAQKQRFLFASAVGLNSQLTADQGQKITSSADVVLEIDALISSLQGDIETPTVRASKIVIAGQEANARNYAVSELSNFDTLKLSTLAAGVKDQILARLESRSKKLATQLEEVLKSEGISAVQALLEKLKGRFERLKTLCQEQSRKAAERILNLRRELENNLDSIGSVEIPKFFFGKNDALRLLSHHVQGFVGNVNEIGVKQRDVFVYDSLVSRFITPLLEQIHTATSLNETRMRQANTVYSQIQEQISRGETSATQVDFRMPIQPNWKEDPIELRRKALRDFSENEFRRLVSSITLTNDDISLFETLSPEVIEAMADRGQPLFRPSRFIDRDIPRGCPSVLALPGTAVITDEFDRVTGVKDLEVPDGLFSSVVGLEHSTRVIALQQHFCRTILEDQYLVECLVKMLSLKPADRVQYFTLKGDMEEMLPPIARAFAAKQLKLEGSGRVLACTDCKLQIYHSPNDKSIKCVGCSK